MTRAPSRPARALRGAAVVLAVLLAARLPVMKAHFDAALRAGGEPGAIGRGVGRALAASPPAGSATAMQPGPVLRPNDRVIERRLAPAAPRAVIAAARPLAAAPASPSVAMTAASPSARVAAAAPPPGVAAETAFAASPDTAPPAARDPAALATAAYARLASGDRRAAVRLFDAALLGDDPRAATWRRQRDALTRRWSGSAYSIVRGSGPTGLASEPVLGGGQSGGALAFTPDPLSRRPLALAVRGSAGHDDAGRSAFASVGVEWHPLAGVTLAAERRIAIGPAARGDWTLRLAAGAERTRGRFHLTAYGEGGVVGSAAYAALQARAAAVVHDGAVTLEPGVGTWASLQRDHGTVDRVDLGPGVVIRAGGVALEVDYRVRAAGNAAPGSGPVATFSVAF